MSEKCLKYKQNGSGRDTYIAHDNGGFYKPIDQLILLKDPGSFVKYPPIKTRTSSFIQRPKRYVNNGSGRDSYIYNDDGGFCPGYKKASFLKILRASETLDQSSFVRKRKVLNKREMLQTIVRKKSQEQISHKLSQPKNRTFDNPEKDGFSNYQLRQTTKWMQGLGHRPTKSLFELSKLKIQ